MQLKWQTGRKFFLIILVVTGLAGGKSYSQMVLENYRNEIYNYLSRMAQKGLITFHDVSRPVDRNYLSACLQQLETQGQQLSSVEKKELSFYLQEYGDTTSVLSPFKDSSRVSFFKNDARRRWRAFQAGNKDFLINVDPIIQGGIVSSGGGNHYTHKSIGVQLSGQIGKHIGFQFYGNDITESRGANSPDSFLYHTPATGFISSTDTGNHQTLNYSDVRAGIGYSWKNGSISLGQDYLLWGYGENGRIVLSDKSPAYPYIRLDYQPFPWLQFQYIHAWLNSDIIDSTRSYGYGNTVYGGKRTIYVPKFMAMHSITVQPTKGLDLSLGESIIYSDRLNIGYFIPVMFFKLYDNLTHNNSVTAGDNGQFFFQVSSRNMLKNTHLYATLLVDEISIAQIFNKDKSRNQIGFNIGGSVTDVFIPYLTLGAEYTRVNPFVYDNLNPAQTYTNHGFSLGDWMGNNFDRWIVSAKYTPLPKLKCLLRYQYIRKGGAGTPEEEYFSQPQPPFLFDYQYVQKELFFNLSYQWLNNLYFNASASSVQQDSKITGGQLSTHTYNFGISYGL
jgi:hypothetical protein